MLDVIFFRLSKGNTDACPTSVSPLENPNRKLRKQYASFFKLVVLYHTEAICKV